MRILPLPQAASDATRPDAPPASTPADDRHRLAVASSVAAAHEAAQRGHYADALLWVATLEAIGDLTLELELARRRWRDALRTGSAAGRASQAPRVPHGSGALRKAS